MLKCVILQVKNHWEGAFVKDLSLFFWNDCDWKNQYHSIKGTP